MNASLGRNDAQGIPVAHDNDHGFCSVCGMVWPCSWARRHAVPLVFTVPTARLPLDRVTVRTA
jgi:hypothetical protein